VVDRRRAELLKALVETVKHLREAPRATPGGTQARSSLLE